MSELLQRFAERAGDYRADVHLCTEAELPKVLSGLLGAEVVLPQGIPPGWVAGLNALVDDGLSPADLDRAELSVLTGCAVAIAETGTLVLDGGPGQGRRLLTLVPDHHVCVVFAHQIVADVPALFPALPDPTRPLTMISGPSATSDIELNRVEGVHGPRRLDIICVTDKQE
jgi:L-lactate dehydrogenase complex protein LldG